MPTPVQNVVQTPVVPEVSTGGMSRRQRLEQMLQQITEEVEFEMQQELQQRQKAQAVGEATHVAGEAQQSAGEVQMPPVQQTPQRVSMPLQSTVARLSAQQLQQSQQSQQNQLIPRAPVTPVDLASFSALHAPGSAHTATFGGPMVGMWSRVCQRNHHSFCCCSSQIRRRWYSQMLIHCQ